MTRQFADGSHLSRRRNYYCAVAGCDTNFGLPDQTTTGSSAIFLPESIDEQYDDAIESKKEVNDMKMKITRQQRSNHARLRTKQKIVLTGQSQVDFSRFSTEY